MIARKPTFLFLVVLAVAALLPNADAFSVVPRYPTLSLSATRPIHNRHFSEAEPSQEPEEPEVPSNPPPPPRPPPQRRRSLDPLVASLTRSDDPSAQSTKTVKAPLFGEVPIDGSLVVLAPALVIGLVGFVMSIYVAINSQDAISDALSQVSNEINQAAVSKTNVVPADGSCRGLCSSQDQDLENLASFLNTFRK